VYIQAIYDMVLKLEAEGRDKIHRNPLKGDSYLIAYMYVCIHIRLLR